jgi:hypothetical protein
MDKASMNLRRGDDDDAALKKIPPVRIKLILSSLLISNPD